MVRDIVVGEFYFNRFESVVHVSGIDRNWGDPYEHGRTHVSGSKLDLKDLAVSFVDEINASYLYGPVTKYQKKKIIADFAATGKGDVAIQFFSGK